MIENGRPMYLIAQLKVKNRAEYISRYGASVIAMLERLGASVLVAEPAPDVLEGTQCDWTVVVKFPNRKIAEAWYHSEEYAPYRKLRITELTTGGSAVFAPGFDPAAFSS